MKSAGACGVNASIVSSKTRKKRVYRATTPGRMPVSGTTACVLRAKAVGTSSLRGANRRRCGRRGADENAVKRFPLVKAITALEGRGAPTLDRLAIGRPRLPLSRTFRCASPMQPCSRAGRQPAAQVTDSTEQCPQRWAMRPDRIGIPDDGLRLVTFDKARSTSLVCDVA